MIASLLNWADLLEIASRGTGRALASGHRLAANHRA
jgi:hypothetical protein